MEGDDWSYDDESIPDVTLSNEDVERLAELASQLSDCIELSQCSAGLLGSVCVAILDRVQSIEQVRNPKGRSAGDLRRHPNRADDWMILGALDLLFAIQDRIIRGYKWHALCDSPTGGHNILAAESIYLAFLTSSDADDDAKDYVNELRLVAKTLYTEFHADKWQLVSKRELQTLCDFQSFETIQKRIDEGFIRARTDPTLKNRKIYILKADYDGIKNGTIDLRMRKVSKRSGVSKPKKSPSKVRQKSG